MDLMIVYVVDTWKGNLSTRVAFNILGSNVFLDMLLSFITFDGCSLTKSDCNLFGEDFFFFFGLLSTKVSSSSR